MEDIHGFKDRYMIQGDMIELQEDSVKLRQ